MDNIRRATAQQQQQQQGLQRHGSCHSCISSSSQLLHSELLLSVATGTTARRPASFDCAQGDSQVS